MPKTSANSLSLQSKHTCVPSSAACVLPCVQEMRALFSAYHGTEQEGAVVEYELREGRYHHGLGAVTRYVWRKAADSDS